MYKTILVPVDLSQQEKGLALLERGQKLLDKGGKLHVMSVVEEVPAYMAVGIPVETLKKTESNAKTLLDELIKKSGAENIATVDIVHGRPPRKIIELSEKYNCDLIMVASHRPGMQDYLLGSTAARVVRHAKCSTLVER